ncbi:Ventricular zone-expressed PH domain-containing protein [Bagarius yarrelli]|uniref:Ventricular zone-expressed PH domain-containing protein n=1 Tax=Bagarius yarrelli TaxID=175774 RepID=A0A556TQG3_BAGYA|nr:Ventricular zone-expressed PH domain-containing protein [Bagarius yarrelli]
MHRLADRVHLEELVNTDILRRSVKVYVVSALMPYATGRDHLLLQLVLGQRDLSRAGDLFSLDDDEIEDCLSQALDEIKTISCHPDYVTNDNDQAVVEICITRITTAIRETCSMERHGPALVTLWESCLKHNLQPQGKDEDTPHAKIASDITSCILQNYNRAPTMALAIPVAVRFLQQGNRELSRNMSSYLSLAAITEVEMLVQHTQAIINSVLGGVYPVNYSTVYLVKLKLDVCSLEICQQGLLWAPVLVFGFMPSLQCSHSGKVFKDADEAISSQIDCQHMDISNSMLLRVLFSVYPLEPDPIHQHIQDLVALIPKLDQTSKQYLLRLLQMISNRHPQALTCLVPYLISHLCDASLSDALLGVLVEVAKVSPASLSPFLPALRIVGQQTPGLLGHVTKIHGAVGLTNEPEMENSHMAFGAESSLAVGAEPGAGLSFKLQRPQILKTLQNIVQNIAT